MADRPGVMIYFDSLRPVLKRLDVNKCGCLLHAILDYAEYGAIPELDQMTGMAFDLLVPKIDRDAERYEENREQRQYAAYCRAAKQKGEQPLGMPEWRLHHSSETTARYGSSRAVTGDTVSLPSTTTSTSTTATTSTSPTTSKSASPAGKGEVEGCKGDGEGEPARIFRKWLSAMDEKDRKAALDLSNQLYALGFNVDIQTKQLKRRT